MKRFPKALSSVLCFGYAFLYIPILSLIIYSFNESKHVTIWAGFSGKWYQALFHNETLLSAALTSLKIALMSASLSVFLGTLAAVGIVKLGDFWGKSFFKGLCTAPLIMPEVILGLAFLLCFIAMQDFLGFPKERGITTITIAHSTIAMSYVIAIVREQLVQFDNSLIEAALDLGATPFKIFFVITLPIIAPSLGAGWLLSFVLSFDDVVVASFVSGPESTTLPMTVFSSIRFGLTPQVNALATLIIAGVMIFILLSAWLKSSQEKISQNEDIDEEEWEEDKFGGPGRT